MNASGPEYPFIDLALANKPYADGISNAIRRVTESGVYIGGGELKRFEKLLSESIGTEYAVGVASGLDALRLTLRALKLLGRLNDGDEVIVASNTYIASVLAITDAGLKPILVDPDQRTMNLSAEGIRRGLTRETKAIMPVHLYGRVCYDDAIKEIIDERSLIVVEDCAQAIGAQYVDERRGDKKRVGTLGNVGCFSFYPTKNVGCIGDGGAVTTDDKELADVVRALGNYGSSERYKNIYPGFNSRLDALQAAILCEKIPYTDIENRRRREKAEAYIREIKHSDILLPELPHNPEEAVWHQFVVRVPLEKRQKFRALLLKKGVETDIHYPTPLHLQPCYRNFFHGSFPIAEKLSGEVVSLPIANHLNVDDIYYISRIINNLKL